MSKIVASPIVETTEEFIKIVENSSADLYELRVDSLENLEINDLKNLSEKLIVTIRSKDEGGIKGISDDKKLSIFRNFLEIEPLFFDIEYKSKLKDQIIDDLTNTETKSILSYHDFDKTPDFETLEELYDNMKDVNPNLIKIVTFCNEPKDNLKMFKLLIEYDGLVSFCMGKLGRISRIFSLLYSPFTYASLSEEKAGPGQLSVEELDKIKEVLLNG